MSASTWIHDADEASFERMVLSRSHSVPVMVDFWATWCGPCRRLGPLLERIVDEQAGKVELVKIDTDKNANLAMRYGIRGIPAVKLFRNGEVVGEFVGAHDAEFIRQFLAAHVSPARDALARAEALVQAKDPAAEPALRELLGDRQVGTDARLLLGRLLLALGRLDEVEAVLAPLGDADPAQHLRQRLAMARDLAAVGGEARARERLAASPDDLDARWALAAALEQRDDHEGALTELLEIVQRDRRYRDDGARRAMLALFDQLGPSSDLARDFRRRLQILT